MFTQPNPVIYKKDMKETFRIVTNASGLCILDPEMVRHRLSDSADWWTISEDLLQEINEGNLYVLDLGSDGNYDVTVEFTETSEDYSNAVNINCKSGKIYIGQAEQVTSDGFEPEEKYGGKYFSVVAGTYSIIARREKRRLQLSIQRIIEHRKNTLKTLPSLGDYGLF